MSFDENLGKSEDKGLTRSKREEKVLQFWKENKIFEKTLEKKSPKGEFVFYEGPPTANGKPGIHHLEGRAFKDAIPRYKTMQGFYVPRKAGWDTHGLPVEIEAEKKLGIKSKKEIEEYGVAKFNEECKKSVLEYIDLWSKFTERIGYWVNLDQAYFTYDNSYIESVWKVIKKADDRKLLYKDYKVVPWCPRCGTALSSHELAQGYQEVKDISLYVKFKIVGFPDAYFVAWTTTPWTLPGNVALAVGKNIVYVEAKVGKEILVLAKDRLSLISEPHEIIAEHKGSEMVGMSYEPLYNFIKSTEKSHKIYTADFVNTEDGTGIVHTAVMYGQEDFDLGNKVGLPKEHLVSLDGKFIKSAGWLEGMSVTEESTSVEILKDLQTKGFLFKKESYTHSYPFCWRCKTRLIYYARDSWYIRMSLLKETLIEENKKINWEPEYIKEGRFGEWLREVKDWAISRERYWGTPLPVWVSDDGDKIVVDSVEDIRKFSKKSKNKYFVMRHGEGENNVQKIVSAKESDLFHLTPKGKEQTINAAQTLKGKIDLIVSSPFLRTRETAELIAREIEYPKEKIVYDNRLAEINTGVFSGGPITEYHAYFSDWKEKFTKSPPGGENLIDLKKRVGNAISDLENKENGKRILIISHEYPIWMLAVAADRAGIDQAIKIKKDNNEFIKNAEIQEISWQLLPSNQNYELDLHKPYIDEIVLVKDGKEYRRVKEVLDVWFDSGAMPFASKANYPADYISEAIDQTRGWFYTLHAVGAIMEKGRAFKNVICLGHILDKEGKKMSKSVGNVVEPFSAIEKYGADTLRLWMYSVNQPGEPKNFDERTVDEINKKVFNLLDNVYAFYDLYRDKKLESEDLGRGSKHVLDRWILSRLDELVLAETENIDNYKLLEPIRDIRDFIDDLSTWYLRRSRDRLKSGDIGAKKTLYFVLKTTSKLLAPFAPFASEELYQKLRIETDPLSVHLESWPIVKKNPLYFFGFGEKKEDLIFNMMETRRIVNLGLQARSKVNIKIRQPLNTFEVKKFGLKAEYVELIKDEVNVKNVVENKNLSEDTRLDINITSQLKEEGSVREIIRNIQEMRKDKGLKPQDKMEYEVLQEEKDLFIKYKNEIEETTNVILKI